MIKVRDETTIQLGTISSIITETIRIHKLEYCHGHKSNESLELGDEYTHDDDDDIEHGIRTRTKNLTSNVRIL